MRKIGIFLLALALLLTLGACSLIPGKQEAKIELYAIFNEATGELSSPIEYSIVGGTTYAFLDYGKPFNQSSLGMSIYQTNEESRMSVYDEYVLIDPEISQVVFAFEIAEAAEYEMVIYFEDPDVPIAKRVFQVQY